MRHLARGAALILGVAVIHACGGRGATREPTTNDPARGAAGYADQSEDQTAGAVSSLDSNDNRSGSYSTMVEMLQGRVSGLQISEGPSGDISVRIRGVNSINAQSEPLLVVDGMPVPAYSFSSTLRTLDPQDVRSVQVLKDAGSTSVYGSRGAAGVILIKLKRRSPSGD
jgi:TonB-dependent SusC/RagA subfamily outer membrane receptor